VEPLHAHALIVVPPERVHALGSNRNFAHAMRGDPLGLVCQNQRTVGSRSVRAGRSVLLVVSLICCCAPSLW
jgi:hypothetical protein